MAGGGGGRIRKRAETRAVGCDVTHTHGSRWWVLNAFHVRSVLYRARKLEPTRIRARKLELPKYVGCSLIKANH